VNIRNYGRVAAQDAHRSASVAPQPGYSAWRPAKRHFCSGAVRAAEQSEQREQREQSEAAEQSSSASSPSSPSSPSSASSPAVRAVRAVRAARAVRAVDAILTMIRLSKAFCAASFEPKYERSICCRSRLIPTRPCDLPSIDLMGRIQESLSCQQENLCMPVDSTGAN